MLGGGANLDLLWFMPGSIIITFTNSELLKLKHRARKSVYLF